MAVMRRAKAGSLPEMFSAMTTAQSLAERVISASIASRTDTVEPALTPSLEGACAAAWAETRSCVSIVSRPADSSSNST